MALLDHPVHTNTRTNDTTRANHPADQSDPSASYVNPNPLWDVEQFAEYLSQKPEFIRQLIKQRRISIVKIGGKVMLEKSTADELILAGRRPATHPLQLDRFGHR